MFPTNTYQDIPTNTAPNTVKNSKKSAYKNHFLAVAISACAIALTGCQTTASMNAGNSSGMVTSGQSAYPELLESFNIRGKIGITTPKTETTAAQSGSAFYVWAQEEDRFAIDITGALGIGHTVIEYNGSSATLVSERTGEIKADSPEELLQQATGWQAPISQLRYWISGRPAPSDDNSQLDEQGRINSTTNGDWEATFTYKDNSAASRLPTKIKVVRRDGHRVIMTIAHTKS